MSSAEVRVFPADLRVETDDHQVAQMASLHVCQETTEPLTVMPYNQQHLCLYRNQPFITCSTPTTMDKISSKRSRIAAILSIVVLMTTKQHPCYHGQTLDCHGHDICHQSFNQLSVSILTKHMQMRFLCC